MNHPIEQRLNANLSGPLALIRESYEMVLVRREDLAWALDFPEKLAAAEVLIAESVRGAELVNAELSDLRAEVRSLRAGIASSIQTLEAAARAVR